MENVGREMEILRGKQNKKTLEIQNTATEMGRLPSMGLSIAYTGQKKASLISKVCGASTKGVKFTY